MLFFSPGFYMKINDIDRTPVAKDIITVCSRCNLELNHVVLRHNTEGIVDRVKCHTCGFEHKYRPVKKQTGGTKTRKTSTRKKSPAKEYEALMQKNLDKVPIPYTIKTSFSEGDVVDHKTFGKGIVTGLAYERVKVLFQDGIKTLAADKK